MDYQIIFPSLPGPHGTVKMITQTNGLPEAESEIKLKETTTTFL